MSDQIPSVGRVVHYVSHGTPIQPDGSRAYEPACRAAMITEVSFDGVEVGEVNLCVFNPTGVFFHDSTYSELNGDSAPVGGTWHWPERV